jgi:glycolate oxidase FAD binding subunit
MKTDEVTRALEKACSEVRDAGAGDAVGGVLPSFVAAPASTEEAGALLRAATSHDLAVVPRGGGSRLGWGMPPSRCDLIVDMSRMDQVLEHAAGDLVAKVQAGVPFGRLAEVLAGPGQQLSLDSPPAATAGGIIATGAAGPRRLRYGTPRDLVIGITVVRADGTVAHSGGKVVKNVAGYDIGKLFAGSFGTLGLITEATFRLHPVPAATAYVTVEHDGISTSAVSAAAATVSAAASSPLLPSAVEIDRPNPGAPLHLGVLVEGTVEGVTERAAGLRELLGAGASISKSPPPWWGQRSEARGSAAAGEAEQTRGAGIADAEGFRLTGDTADGVLVRIAFWVAALPRVLNAADAAAADTGLKPAVGGSAGAGVLYARLGADAEPDAVAEFVHALRRAVSHGTGAGGGLAGGSARGSAVVLAAPPAVRAALDMWGPVPSPALMRAVKDQFDPGHRMAPGRFAGGI